MGESGLRTERGGMPTNLPPRLLLAALLALALAACAPFATARLAPSDAASASGATAGRTGDAGYWAVADRLQQRLDAKWSERAGRYALDAPSNANALLTLSVAALEDHHGPARNDARARRLARALTAGPPFVATPPPAWHDAQTHAPGFVESMTSRHSNQHLVIDSAIVDGLKYAWLARRQLGLSRRLGARIADRIHRTAMGSYWRWPTVRLNQ